MSDNEDFDSLFAETPSEPAMTEARVRQIASDQHFRDQAAMQQAAQAAGQRRAAALERAEQRHRGFRDLYNNSQVVERFKQEHNRSANWIGLAEVAGDAADIDDAYDSLWNWHIVTQNEPSEQTGSGAVKHPLMPAPASAFSLQEINKLPVERRRPVLEALKDRIGDEPIDSADTTAEALQVVRRVRSELV